MEKKNINWDKIFNFAYYFLLVLLIIWLICFRTEIWLHKAAFSHDELFLLKNIQEKTFFDLFKTLDYIQCCPAFFLIFNKIVYNIYGLNEVALCFLPYIAGIFSIILIPFLSNKIFKHKTIALLFLVFFAYQPHLTRASQTFKQYSTDIFCTILLLFLFFTFKDKIKTSKHFLLTGIIFGLFGYISFTSEFIMFPMFIYFIHRLIKNKNIKSIVLITLPYLFFLGAEYLLLKNTYGNGMNAYWNLIQPAYMSYKTFSILITNFFFKIFNEDFVFGLFLIGITILLKKEKLFTYILLSPIILNIISQFLKLYPFPNSEEARVIVYFIPLLMIIFLKTIELLLFLFNFKQKYLNTIIIIIMFIIIIYLNLFYSNKYIKERKYLKNTYYYYITTPARDIVTSLSRCKIKDTDKILIVDVELLSFDVYSDNKYEKNVITYNENYNSEIFDNIKTNSNIYFYEHKYFRYKIPKLFKENCKILMRERDDMGELFYVKKIK